MEYNKTLAEADIKSLLVRERYFRDSCQWDKLRNAYHPDASKTSINISWYNGDIDGFVTGSREMATKGLSAMHIINPVDIDIKESKAFAVSVGSINARFERGGHDFDIISHCRFLSRLGLMPTQNGGGVSWKMLTMEVIYVQDMILPAFPGVEFSTLVLDNLPRTSRKSYRYLTWLLRENGREVDDRMPGVDDELSVQNVLEKNYSWLNS